MNIFDKYAALVCDMLNAENIENTSESGIAWKTSEKHCFLMERDTAVELGGYPKESVNLIISSDRMSEIFDKQDGVYIIGDEKLILGNEKHISFGKVVLLETDQISDDAIYEFTQNELLTDSRIKLDGVMLRQSPSHYNINYRVGKSAVKDGFNADKMGWALHDAFSKMESVKAVRVILIVGDTPIYKQLIEIAEKKRELTLTLNHIFDGIDMDCGSCELVEVCNEVEEMRELHKKRSER